MTLADGSNLVDVLGSGAILLGPTVTCDGFRADRPIRVQTHIHSDHMEDFTTSLRGEVVMTKMTRELLGHKHPALSSRNNVHVLDYGEIWEYEGNRIQLVSSNHMLGAAQVKLTLKSGISVGYSGDFGWPLDNVIEVDELVVDATYGNPSSRGVCPQEDAQEALVDLVRKKLRRGPVHLMADTGPLERALLLLAMSDVMEGVPTIASKRTCWYGQVHREYGRPIPSMLTDGSEAACAALKAGRYVRIWSLNSRQLDDGLHEGSVIRLTKYGIEREPIEERSDGSFTIGLSNHADFLGTLAYVEATGAEHVVTDSHRGRDRADHLAKALRAQLRISARVSTNSESLEWGK